MSSSERNDRVWSTSEITKKPRFKNASRTVQHTAVHLHRKKAPGAQ